MKHLFTTRVKVVLIAAVLIAVLLAVASNLTGKNYPGMIVQTIMAPLRTGAKVMTNQAEQVISIKADSKTQMGIITDIKEVLRKSWALRINYSATRRQ